MCKVISFINCKGGVGKSVGTINIGAALAMQGKKVVAVDCDPQNNLTTYLNIKPRVKITLPELMKMVMENADLPDDELAETVHESIIHTKYLDVLPSHISMAGLEMGIAMATRREYILSRILDSVKNGYDFLLLDCLPSLGIFALNALTASDSVIIPTETHYGALEGFDQVLATVKMVRRQLNPKLEIEGVMMTKHMERTNFCRSVREMLVEECGEEIKLFETPVPYSIKVAETSALGVSIFEHDPRNPAATAYDAIAREVAAHAEQG